MAQYHNLRICRCLTVDLAAVTNGLFVPHVGHRHHRFRCAHNERPLFSRHSGIGIYAVAAISMLRVHAAQIQWLRCGLAAVIRRFYSDDRFITVTRHWYRLFKNPCKGRTSRQDRLSQPLWSPFSNSDSLTGPMHLTAL